MENSNATSGLCHVGVVRVSRENMQDFEFVRKDYKNSTVNKIASWEISRMKITKFR